MIEGGRGEWEEDERKRKEVDDDESHRKKSEDFQRVLGHRAPIPPRHGQTVVGLARIEPLSESLQPATSSEPGGGKGDGEGEGEGVGRYLAFSGDMRWWRLPPAPASPAIPPGVRLWLESRVVAAPAPREPLCWRLDR